MNKQQLKQWIKDNIYHPNPNKLNIKRVQKDGEWINKFHPDIYAIIIESTNFLINPSMKERIYCILNDIHSPVLCKNCEINTVNFHKKGYLDYCCQKCALSDKKTLDKKKQTRQERYGDPNYNNREKFNKTCEERYGYKHHWMNEEIRDKRIETWQQNLGVDNPSQNQEIKDKKKQTCLKNHGVEIPYQSEDIKQKGIDTCREKYGVDNVFQLEETKEKLKETKQKNYGDSNYNNREKSKQTMLKKYGAENPQHIPDFCPKGYGYKNSWHDHELSSGKIIKLQGYEPYVLNILLEYYNEEEILYKRSDMPEIWYYTEDGKKHRYYPDFYIPKDNLVIEVKSEYTYHANLEINLLKEQFTKELGYDYRLMIMKR